MKQIDNQKIEKFNLKGFTLVELIVSISIIVVIAGIYVVNYRQTNNRADVKMAAQKMVSEIRQAQNYAMSLKEMPQSAGVPQNGWGVRFQSGIDEMLIYADDRNPPKKYKGAGDEETLDPFTFADNVKIHDLEIDGVSGIGFLYVTTLPPNPDVFICGDNNENSNNLQYPIGPNPPNDCEPSGNNAYITLIYDNDLNSLVKVHINRFGLVEVN